MGVSARMQVSEDVRIRSEFLSSRSEGLSTCSLLPLSSIAIFSKEKLKAHLASDGVGPVRGFASSGDSA
jgi:hypothetical protein